MDSWNLSNENGTSNTGWNRGRPRSHRGKFIGKIESTYIWGVCRFFIFAFYAGEFI